MRSSIFQPLRRTIPAIASALLLSVAVMLATISPAYATRQVACNASDLTQVIVEYNGGNNAKCYKSTTSNTESQVGVYGYFLYTGTNTGYYVWGLDCENVTAYVVDDYVDLSGRFICTIMVWGSAQPDKSPG